MSLIFMDGMYYATNDLWYKYSYIGSIMGGSSAISSETRRTGPGSINVPPAGSTGHSIRYEPPHPLVGTIVGFALKTIQNGTPQTWFRLGGSGISITFGSDRSLTIACPGGSATTVPNVLTFGVWSYLELRYIPNSVTGSVTLRHNDVVVAEILNKNITANTTYVNWYNSFLEYDYYFQDLYVLDGIGSTNNNFLGDCKVEICRPNAPGTHTDFTPSAGANWENVDEADCDDDVSYNDSGVIGDKDTYNLSNITITGTSIFGIQQQSIIRKTDATARHGQQTLISGATESLSVEYQFNDEFTAYQRILEKDPNTDAAWVEAGVNAIESGVTVVY